MSSHLLRNKTNRHRYDLSMLLLLFLFISIIRHVACQRQEVNEMCTFGEKKHRGICKTIANCSELERKIAVLNLTKVEVGHCGFTLTEEIICCPELTGSRADTGKTDSTTKPTPTKPNTSGTPRSGNERKAVRACRKIEELIDSEPPLGPQVLGGTIAQPGDYPHMVALGFLELGAVRPPYDYRCGGTLISENFVLTAAHCVYNPKVPPKVVLLGTVNLDERSSSSGAKEIAVKKVYLADDYRSLQKYHDIALLELEEKVEYNALIFPACLYTNELDPPNTAQMNITGFGTKNITTKELSRKLLQATVNLMPLEECKLKFSGNSNGLLRGVIESQICTFDSTFTRDACWGDSGGPLYIADPDDMRKVRIIGVISAGEGCASAMPGLYTRIASYLSFIEKIVWPDL